MVYMKDGSKQLYKFYWFSGEYLLVGPGLRKIQISKIERLEVRRLSPEQVGAALFTVGFIGVALGYLFRIHIHHE